MKKVLVLAMMIGFTSLASAKEKIVFWHAMGGKLQGTLNKIVEEYNKLQDKVEVEALYQGEYINVLNKFKSVQKTENAPTLLQVNDISTEYMYRSGAITPMENFIKKDGFNKSVLEPALINYYTVNGTLYSMPFNSSASVLIYNKDAFIKAGLNPNEAPKSFKEIVEYSEKIKNSNNSQYGFALIMDAWFIEQMLANLNSLYLNKENGRKGEISTEVAYDNGSIDKIYSWLREMYEKKLATSYGKEFQSTRSAFLSGKVAMYLDSSAGIQELKETANFDVGVARIPNETGVFNGVPIGGASLWITNSVSKEKQEAAWDFVKFAVSKESQGLWATETGYFAVNKEAYDTEKLQESLKKTPQKLVAINEIKDSKGGVVTSGAISGVFSELRKVMTDSLEKVYDGKEKNSDIEKELVKKSNRILKRYEKINQK